MSTTDPRDDVRDLVEQVRGHITAEQAWGLDPELMVTDDVSQATSSPVPTSAPAQPSAAPDQAERILELNAMATEVAACQRCDLCQERTQTVFGDGHPNADLVFVGEGPGAEEDRQGIPFVGRAGQLLTKMIESIGMTREEVYIGNIVKCRPPKNRAPLPTEIAACRPYLIKQLALLQPKVIVTLGNVATQAMLQNQQSISRLRGHFQDFNGIALMPTFHPAYLLRSPSKKQLVWEDLQLIRDRLKACSP